MRNAGRTPEIFQQINMRRRDNHVCCKLFNLGCPFQGYTSIESFLGDIDIHCVLARCTCSSPQGSPRLMLP